jgi:hypothetical protein
VGLERDPLSLVSTIEELLERKSSGSGLESREYGRRGSAALTARHPLSANVGTNLAEKQRLFGRYTRGLRPRSFCFGRPNDHRQGGEG